jgi:lipopolysaccharide export system protein LptA
MKVALGAVIVSLLLLGCIDARAETQNPLLGFADDRNEPLEIKGNLSGKTMCLLDAPPSVCTGSHDTYGSPTQVVEVSVGDTIIKCRVLKVYYERDGAPGDLREAPDDGWPRRYIRRLEAFRDVLIKRRGQKASSDEAIFDMRENVIALGGNVVVIEGQNIMRGGRLTVDLAAKTVRMEPTKPRNLLPLTLRPSRAAAASRRMTRDWQRHPEESSH